MNRARNSGSSGSCELFIFKHQRGHKKPNRTECRAAERATRKLEQKQSKATATIPQDTAITNDADRLPSAASSAAQIHANQMNSQLSTGPTTPEGRAAVSQNHRTHGLTGSFALLPHEDASEFQLLANGIYAEHQPESITEQLLGKSILHHYWLTQRALYFQQEIILGPGN